MTRTIRSIVFAAISAATVASQVVGLSAQTKAEKDRAEAAAQYQRGLTFSRQGAYKEAEQALRQAEKKDDKNIEYQFAVAFTYIKLHKPDDAMKRYSKIYKNDPTNARALVGIAATYEEMLNYREAVRMWMRYSKMNLPPDQKSQAQKLLRSAQELFARDYEITENPAGGAANAATPEQEQQWGLQFAQQLASTGIPLVKDDQINAYVQDLCAKLIVSAKRFPAKYQLFVLDSPTINAQTTPGFIFVYRGILETVSSEAELAGVLAHEIGHTVAHHTGKAMTKSAQDKQQLEALQRSDSKWAKFLAGLMAAGNPLGQLAFSREEETQADRLGIHISFDSGYDPRGLATLFRKFEGLQPSSRRSWDLMMQTHPFSIDRMNMVNDYVELLPERPLKTTSPAFERMKARLAKLPPPPEAAPAAPPKGDAASSNGAVIPFTLDNAPFAGEIPANWGARKTNSGTIAFEGQQGTEAYEATVELEVAPKTDLPGKSLADVADIVYKGTAAKPNANVQRPEAQSNGSLQAYSIHATYPLQSKQGPIGFQHVSIVIEYPAHFVIFSYYAPATLYAKYLPVFQQIGASFKYTGR
jgi:beta-barrel assembly-enhancing protease